MHNHQNNVCAIFSLFPKLKINLYGRLDELEDFIRNTIIFTLYQKKCFTGASTNEILAGIRVLNVNKIDLRKSKLFHSSCFSF